MSHHKSHGRNARQRQVGAWCVAAFGVQHARNVPQRALRMVEEAIEAAQAAGCPRDMVMRLVQHIYAKPVGDLRAEIGGVGVTLLALAEAADISADGSERGEFERVQSKPLAFFAARNAAKDAAGFRIPPASSIDPPCPYCVGAGGWEAAPGRAAYEWRACHECHGSGLAKESA